MAATLRAASSANLGSTAAASVTPTLPTGATTGDIVYILVATGSSSAASWSATTGWTLLDGATGTINSGGTGHATNVAWKVLAAGDGAPTISWTNGGKTTWVAIAFQPGAGETLAHDLSATPTVSSTLASTHTPPSLAAGADSGVSVLLNGSRAGSAGSTAITTTPPTNWTEPTNGDNSTAVGTTTTTRQVGAEVCYQLAQTGTITPGTETITGGTAGGTTTANLYHVLLTSTGATAAPVPARVTVSNPARVRASYW